jgi:putative peptidoglycan lipid II flippase
VAAPQAGSAPTPGRLARSAGLIGLATFSSRVLGLVRDVVQAYFFGTGLQADAFTVATRIPTLLRDLFAEGAMSAAFVPTLSRVLARDGSAGAWRLGAQVINGLVLATGVIVLLGILFAEPLVHFYASGFADTPEKLALTVRLTRVNMPFLLLVAVAAACMGMLNAVRRFFMPALAPALYNVVFIACTAALVPFFSRVGIEPVMALSAGMLLGGAAQMVTQWPALRGEGYRHEWRLDPKDPGLREILWLMGPATLGVAAAQINLLVNTKLATAEDGAATALGYAFRLIYMPIGIIGVSVATAAIPELARHAATKAIGEMRSTLSWGLRLMLMLSVPATLGLIVLAGPVVRLIFERGDFNAESTAMTAAALAFYAPGIVGYSIVKIASPSFYSLQDARTPMIVSVMAIGVNLALNLWLNALMGFRGLALGSSIAANLNAVLLLWLLARRIGGIEARRVTLSLLKILAASLAMAAATWWTERLLSGWLPPELAGARVVSHVLSVFGAIAVGVGVLALGAWALRIQEFQQAVTRLAGRFRRSPERV